MAVLCTLGSIGLAMSGALSAWASASATAEWSGTPSQQAQWLEGLELVATGQFDKGTRLINQVVAAGVQDPRIANVQRWLKDYDTLSAERAERRRADFETYAGWVKEDAHDGNWIRAIAECALAFTNTDDEEAFRKEPWVVETVEGSLKSAQAYEKEDKWYKAATIYVQLEEIFPRNAEYRKALLRCQEHIRLELSYTPTSDWESAVADISPQMAEEAFKRIYLNYIKEISFQESAAAALEQLMLMTKTPKLAKAFEKLNQEDEVDEFRERIQALSRRVQAEKDLSWVSMTEIFEKVLQINREIDLFPQEVLIREYVQGALKPLDRFTDMLWPADTDEFNKHTQGTFTGVGISIRKDPGAAIEVISPMEDTPAYAAVIQSGDMITQINGKPAAPLTITKAVQMITGPTGTTVTLTIERPGNPTPFEKKLVRAEITIYTVKGYARDGEGQWDYLIDPDNRIGYIRITNFTERTTEELSAALKSLVKDHAARGVILDLRSNPGGLLKTAVEVTNLFLAGDKEIVSTQDRRGKDMQMFTSEPEGDHYPNIPLILLVNSTSASASEIVTGALQVHQRAWVLGERTFGKGSVQQVLPLTPGRQALLKLTTYRYYLPNGRCLHQDDDSETWGVDPDVKLALVPKEIIKVAKLRTRKDILKGLNQTELTDADYDRVLEKRTSDEDEDSDTPTTQASSEDDEEEEDPREKPRTDPNNWPEIDPQLDAALLLMRVRVETGQPWPAKTEAVAAKPVVAPGS